MAFASIAALAAGGEATAALVLGAVSEVGVAMTVVGAVTGDKSLMKIGGVMGLVGGVGGMMAGASGAAGAAGATSAESLGAADTAGGLVPAYGTDATYAAGLGDTSALGSSLGADGAASDASSLGGASDFSSMVDDAQKSLGDTNSTVSGIADPSTVGDANPAGIAAPSTSAPASPGVTGQAVDARNGMDVNSDNFDASTANNGSTAGSPGGFGPPTDSKNYFSNLLSWVKNNKEVTNGILKIGGDALKGMSERDMFDQKMAQERNLANQRYGFGNQVATYAPRPLIGAH